MWQIWSITTNTSNPLKGAQAKAQKDRVVRVVFFVKKQKTKQKRSNYQAHYVETKFDREIVGKMNELFISRMHNSLKIENKSKREVSMISIAFSLAIIFASFFYGPIRLHRLLSKSSFGSYNN